MHHRNNYNLLHVMKKRKQARETGIILMGQPGFHTTRTLKEGMDVIRYLS